MNRRIQSVKMMHAGRVWASACAMWIGLAMALPLAASTAQITTSQKQYSVGEGMIVYGTKFTPSAMVTLTVVRPDKLVDSVPGVTTDTQGNFTANYTPPLEPGRYTFTATDGANSATTATTGADAIGYNKGVYNKADTTHAGGAGTWTTGNAGSNYLENQWTFYQYQVTGVGDTVPSFNIEFNHWQSNTNAIFVDAFANFRACVDCQDSSNLSGPNQGMLLDGIAFPPTSTTNWVDAHSAISRINTTYTTDCLGTFDPQNTPSTNHCFHVDGDALAALFPGVVGPGSTGSHSITLFYEAHLAFSQVWTKGKEALLACAGSYYVQTFPEFQPAFTVYGTDAYNPNNPATGVTLGTACDTTTTNNGLPWTASFMGIGSATGSSRNFQIQNPTAGPNGGLTLPIPSVPAPTGSITITKVTVPSPASGAVFGFTGDLGAFSLRTDGVTPNSVTFSGLEGGLTYNVAETGLTGWNLTGLSCTGSGSTFVYSAIPAASGNVAITLSTTNNASVTCTFTNSGSATLKIVKNTVGGDGTFNYAGSGSGVTASFQLATSGGTSQISFDNIVVGPKAVTEQVPAGWDLTSLGCVSANSTSTFTVASTPVVGSASATAAVNGTLAAGDTVTCTFTNTKEATLAIQKHTLGGTGSFSFGTSGTGAAGFTSGFSRDTSGANPTTSPAFSFTAAQFGAKTVQETIPSGWNLTNITCTAGSATIVFGTGGASFVAGSTPTVFQAGDDTIKVTLAAGNTPNCTFENTRQASIVIRKQTVGGTGTFTYATDLTGGSPSVVAAGNFSITTVSQNVFVAETFSNATPGSHSVTETLPSGWSLTSLSCSVTGTNGSTGAQDGGNPLKADITLNAGDTVTCDYTNAKDATIVLVKNTVGGNAAFGFTASGVGLSATSITTSNGTGSHTYSNIVPGSGSWSFAETVPTGWTGNTTNVGCVANPATGTTIGGNPTTGAVAGGGTVTSPTITTIAAGATVTCTFTNSKDATIVLVKNTVGGDGTFPFTASGGLTPSSFNVTTAGFTKSTTFANIAPGSGSWSFAETVPTGWEGNTTPVGCSVTTAGAGGTTFGATGTAGLVPAGGTVTSPTITALGAGATVTCAFYNSTLPTLQVVKYIHGTGDTFTFNITSGPDSGLAPIVISVPANGSNSAGPYLISVTTANNADVIAETLPTLGGWTMTDISCTGASIFSNAGPVNGLGIPTNWSFAATYGDHVICTFVNSNVLTTRTQGFWATHTGLANAVWGGGNGTTPPSGVPPVAGSGDDIFSGGACGAGFTITALTSTEENVLMGGFWANISQTTTGKGKSAKRSAIDQARMQMLQQYLAAVLNSHMWGAPVPGGGLSAARTAYCGTDASAIQSWIGILGGYNSSGDSLPFTPGASATPQVSKGQADIDAWDEPTNPVDN